MTERLTVPATIHPLITNGNNLLGFMLTSGAPSNLKAQGRRLVWILARPLEAIPYSTVAGGVFPYLHWAVFISPKGWGNERMTAIFEHLQNDSPYNRESMSIGTIHELRLVDI